MSHFGRQNPARSGLALALGRRGMRSHTLSLTRRTSFFLKFRCHSRAVRSKCKSDTYPLGQLETNAFQSFEAGLQEHRSLSQTRVYQSQSSLLEKAPPDGRLDSKVVLLQFLA